MIYSEAFEALPSAVKDSVYRQLFDVLSGKNQTQAFAHLTPDNRKTIREILSETSPNWRQAVVAYER